MLSNFGIGTLAILGGLLAGMAFGRGRTRAHKSASRVSAGASRTLSEQRARG